MSVRRMLLGPIVQPMLLLCAAVWSGNVPAAQGAVKGQIQYIRTHDAGTNPTWAPPRFWFTLKGVSVAGTCHTFDGGNGVAVLFEGNDRQELALVMAAQASGQEIEATFDDTILVNGYCSVLYVTSGNPAPLY